MTSDDDRRGPPTVDPEEFLRALLKISPEDAEKVRERTPGTRQKPEKQVGPSADYGDGNK